jgi:hypothetical protein
MGLTRFSTKAVPFKRYRHDFGDPNSTDEPFVGAIYEDRQGILWIGNHEALNRIDRTTGHYSSYPTAGPREGSDVITIREDRSGSLWVGTFSHWLYRFDPHHVGDPWCHFGNDRAWRLVYRCPALRQEAHRNSGTIETFIPSKVVASGLTM